jgi:hypothetical protein
METNKYCQSCGMPMKQDPQKGATNADGTLNQKYCSYCYQEGKFTWEGNVSDFQEFCRQKMIEGGHNRLMSWVFTRGMSRLERWKSK